MRLNNSNLFTGNVCLIENTSVEHKMENKNGNEKKLNLLNSETKKRKSVPLHLAGLKTQHCKKKNQIEVYLGYSVRQWYKFKHDVWLFFHKEGPFCSFDLFCFILEKKDFIKNSYIVLPY